MARPLRVTLKASAAAALDSGQPWVYRENFPAGFSAADGSWLELRVKDRRAFALYSTAGAIAARVFSKKGVPTAAWLEQRARRAYDARALLRREKVSAYRCVNGEGDGLPGVVADLYGAYCVCVTYAAGLEALLPSAVRGFAVPEGLKGALWKSSERDAKLELLSGSAPRQRLIVEEYGVRYFADLKAGHKTGLYLDQRENRRFIAKFAQNKTMLNLYGYTGGFTLHALKAGAVRVCNVDQAEPALEAARENFELNGEKPERHQFVRADVVEYLKATGPGESYDIVVVDPPSFARNKQQRAGALKTYKRLFSLAMRRVNQGGLLAAASCTAQVGPEDFRRMLAEAAQRARRRLQVIHEVGHALDHPVMLQHREGRYLKFVVGRVLSGD